MKLALLFTVCLTGIALVGCNVGSRDGGASQRAEDASPQTDTPAPVRQDGPAGYETPPSAPIMPAQSPQPSGGGAAAAQERER